MCELVELSLKSAYFFNHRDDFRLSNDVNGFRFQTAAADGITLHFFCCLF